MKKLLIIPLLFACYMSIGQTESSAFIIGKPIRIGNLLVAQKDFPNQMNWDDAVKSCSTLGKYWRLPTKDELNKLYLNKDIIGSFTVGVYWSNTDSVTHAWRQGFAPATNQYKSYKSYGYKVRAVRTIK